ncbi:response regulator transcription factor [Micromonospora fluostatini]|uniref:Response regulator transcription factor n=1 Tax=Micromonospora fluostatini TaxID=1629071 RepID=A0ABY2DC08_9ACTN|nr:response regulator transcription factor [Micromonospora fluostatini]
MGSADKFACCRWVGALSKTATLTDREMQVFTLLAKGEQNQVIADQLFITERTVRAHLANIMTKLDLSSRMQACLASYVFIHDRADTRTGPRHSRDGV